MKATTDTSYQSVFKDVCFCSGIHIQNTPGNIKSNSVALRITVHACLRTHTNTLQESTITRTLNTKLYLLLTTLLDRHIPGLNGMVQGILVSPLIQVHKHQGRTLTIPFPKSAASSYQNLQDRSKQEAYIIKHRNSTSLQVTENFQMHILHSKRMVTALLSIKNTDDSASG